MKNPETGPTTDELIAKYSTKEDGGFPYPEIKDGMSEEQVAEVNRVRGAVRRKAQGALVDFVIDNKADLEDSLTEYQHKAISFLTAERTRGRKADGVAKSRTTIEDKVYNFFADPANHTDASGEAAPGKIAAVNVYMHLDMDATRTLGAAKRILDSRPANERLWIGYKSSERCYTVAGPQAEAPEGWTGPLPAPKTAADLTKV